MALYTARVRLAQGIIDPRGRGAAVMTHHANLPGDLAAEQWCAEVADIAQNGLLGQRWIADRSGVDHHVVEVFGRSLEDRTVFRPVAEVRFSLDPLVGNFSIPIPGTEVGQITFTAMHVAPDPGAAVLVIEDGFASTVPVSRRCYVGPIGPTHLVAQVTVDVVGSSALGYNILPGTANDEPADLFDTQGWWPPRVADAAAHYLRGINERAEDVGGKSAVVSWKNGTISAAVQWRASSVRARMRSRGTGTTFRPPVQR